MSAINPFVSVHCLFALLFACSISAANENNIVEKKQTYEFSQIRKVAEKYLACGGDLNRDVLLAIDVPYFDGTASRYPEYWRIMEIHAKACIVTNSIDKVDADLSKGVATVIYTARGPESEFDEDWEKLFDNGDVDGCAKWFQKQANMATSFWSDVRSISLQRENGSWKINLGLRQESILYRNLEAMEKTAESAGYREALSAYIQIQGNDDLSERQRITARARWEGVKSMLACRLAANQQFGRDVPAKYHIPFRKNDDGKYHVYGELLAASVSAEADTGTILCDVYLLEDEGAATVNVTYLDPLIVGYFEAKGVSIRLGTSFK